MLLIGSVFTASFCSQGFLRLLPGCYLVSQTFTHRPTPQASCEPRWFSLANGLIYRPCRDPYR